MLPVKEPYFELFHDGVPWSLVDAGRGESALTVKSGESSTPPLVCLKTLVRRGSEILRTNHATQTQKGCTW